jgi:diguanylate cyclase (GGDEF)-like protein
MPSAISSFRGSPGFWATYFATSPSVLVVLPGTTRDGAIEAAERIRAAFAELNFATGARSVRMTASFGVAAFVPRTDAQELVHAADQALYAAKRRGKNRVEAASEVVATSA